MKRYITRLYIYIMCALMAFSSIYMSYIPANATQEELNGEAEERKKDPVETNEVEGWPDGPLIGADGAILMDADSGAILYAKNIDKKLFPASTTKVMTSLLVAENCQLDETVRISEAAVNANASDGSNMNLNPGEVLTVEDLLYGVLINSANEACNALAEHVAGSMENYVQMMNNRANELGCTNTHFVTTNGLHDENHYTTAHDLALIAKEFFSHDVLCRMSSTVTYKIPATDSHGEHNLSSHNRLYEGQTYEYEYLVGSKTGFTSHSRQTLVSCAEKDGMKLICVIMREESPYQFEDTIALFDYGFNNFSAVNIGRKDTTYNMDEAPFFASGDETYGSTRSIFELDKNSKIIIPNGIDISELTTSVNFIGGDTDSFARIDYSYNSRYLGSAKVGFTKAGQISILSDEEKKAIDNAKVEESEKKEKHVIIDIRKILITIVIIAVSVIVVFVLIGFGRSYLSERMRISKIKKNRSSGRRRRSPVRRTLVKPEVRRPQKQTGFVKKSRRRTYKPPMRQTLRKPDEKNNNSFKSRHDINFKDYDF